MSSLALGALQFVGELWQLSNSSPSPSVVTRVRTIQSNPRGTRVHLMRSSSQVPGRTRNNRNSAGYRTTRSRIPNWSEFQNTIDEIHQDTKQIDNGISTIPTEFGQNRTSHNAISGIPTEFGQNRTSQNAISKKLSSISMIPLYLDRFRQWMDLAQSHENCCGHRRMTSFAERIKLDLVPLPNIAIPAVQVSAEQMSMFVQNGQKFHLSEGFTRITQSLCLQENCQLIAKDMNENNTLYVNWTNMFVPGFGFVGHVPHAECKVDDIDELELFWNSDISMYLHPKNEAVAGQNLYPMEPFQSIYCENVSVYNRTAPQKKQKLKSYCTTRLIAVLNTALDTTIIYTPEEQKSILYLLFNNILKTSAMKKKRHIIIPVGRLIRLGFVVLLIAHCLCKVFLPAMIKSDVQTIEILIPSVNKKTKLHYYNTIQSVVNVYCLD